MSPDEENLLRQIGVILLGNLAGFTAMTLVYGVFVLLFSISTYKMANRGIKSRSTVGMFVMSLLSFLIATVYWCAYLASFATLVRGILVDTDIGPLDRPDGSFDGINDKNRRFIRMQNWTAQLLPLFSNAVLIARVRFLYPKDIRVVIVPIVLLLGSIGTGLRLLGVMSTEDANVTVATGASIFWKHVFISYLSITLATTIVNSILISIEVIRLQKDRGNIGNTLKISQARVFVIILIESGVLFAVCQAINFGLEFVNPTINQDSSLAFAAIVITSIYVICSAMYPTVSLLLITVQRSIPHLYGQIAIEPKKPSNVAMKTGQRSATRNNLVFAAPTTTQTIHGTVTSIQNPHVVSLVVNNDNPDKAQTVLEISTNDGKMDEKQTKTAPF